MIPLAKLQAEVNDWARDNFGDNEANPLYRCFLGAIAHLKHEQAIRGMSLDDTAHEAKVDAVADIIIYLADYCARSNIDMAQAVHDTWDKVSRRNWKENPDNAHETET